MKNTIILALYYFYRALNIAILVYCIGSWFVNPGSKLFYYWRKLGYFLEPLFRPARMLWDLLRQLLRRIFPNIGSIPIDFTPWLTVILLEFLFRGIIRLLYLI